MPGLNQDYETDSMRFGYSSPFVFSELYEYSHKKKQKRLIRSAQLQGPQIVRNDFELKYLSVPATDGEEIPLTLMHKKGLKLDRKNKTLLEGYGAYGIPMTTEFSITNLSALEKGWVIAKAQVRGGGDKGIAWHEKGKLADKPNSFDDFICCAEHLIASRITHPNLLAAKGESAGGTLVGQVANMRPDLFRACILNVPFMDVLTALLDETLPLTHTDHKEFGNPITDKMAY